MPPRKTSFELPKLTLKEILRGTPGQVKARSSINCRPSTYQYSLGSREGFKRTRPKYPTFYNEYRLISVCDKKRRYSYIRFYGPPALDTPVWVWCSCEWFGYTCEWVLDGYGSSSLHPGYENRGPRIKNAPPKIRNPQEIPCMCKHLVLATKLALKQKKDLAADEAKKREEKEQDDPAMRVVID